MRLTILATAVVLAAGVAVNPRDAAAASDLPPLTLAEVNFHSMPRAQPGAGLYPPEALKARVEGHATVVCRVLTDGDLTECAVTEETPPGFGFGAKVLENARSIRIYGLSRYNAPTPGRLLAIPMKFTLPPGA